MHVNSTLQLLYNQTSQHEALITVHLYITVMSPVWSLTIARPTPRRPTRPSCPAALLPATVVQVFYHPQPHHASLCPHRARPALHGLHVAHPASRAPSSMTVLTFTLLPPRPPPADPLVLLSQPPCPQFPRLTAYTSRSYFQSQS